MAKTALTCSCLVIVFNVNVRAALNYRDEVRTWDPTQPLQTQDNAGVQHPLKWLSTGNLIYVNMTGCYYWA